MIRLVLLLMLLSATALGQTQQTFPAYVTSRTPATTPLSGQCFPVSNGVATTKLCSGYAVAIGALSAANNLSDLGSLTTARLNLFSGVPFGALSKCLGLDNVGNVISGSCTPQTISAIALSNTTVIGGTVGATVGTISVSLSPPSPGFSGTLAVDDQVNFAIAGNVLKTNVALASGNYPITIMASEPTTTNSPVSQAFNVVTQTLQAIVLSNNTIVSGQPSGTTVGQIVVNMNPAAPGFSGSLSLTGASASSFRIAGNVLQTNGVVNSGSYNVNVVASQGGTSISQPETIVATAQTISQVILSNTAVIGGASSANQLVGNVYVIMSPASPAFSGTLSLTGTNASSFALSGSVLNVGASNLTNGTTYNFNVVATQAGATGSPKTQAITVTPAAATWVNDQTQPMPYVCLTQLWINPSTSPSGATGAGSDSGNGSQSSPFLHASNLNGKTVTPGTCINLVNAAALYDTLATANITQNGTFSNAPDGYVVLRSTDNTGSLVEAAGVGGGLNSSATKWTSNSVAHNNGQLVLAAPSDYWIVDGINFWMRGYDRMVQGLPCIQVGATPGNNVFPGLTHFQARGNYVHGCGAGGFNIAGSDYVALHNNVIASVAISNPTLQESAISICCGASPNGYTPTGYDLRLCTTMAGSCVAYHDVVSANLMLDPYEAAVNQTTDGNCFIEDTNVVPASQTNAGPYLYRTLVVNNVGYHCGGNGFYVLNSQHIDVVNNTVVRSNFDTHNPGEARGGFFCFFTLDCVMVNNVVYGVSANTSVNLTSTGTVLSVDDVSGFFRTANQSGGVPPSPSSPITVLVDGIGNQVVGFTIDSTNVSTTPGGVSGTLTFNTSISAPHGNRGVQIVLNAAGFNDNSPLANNIGLNDSQSGSTNTCIPWGQPVPCSGGNVVTINWNGVSDFWYNNLGYLINSQESNPARRDALSVFCPSCAVPPTETAAPGNNILATDPQLTAAFFSVNPNYEMIGVSPSGGSTCTSGEVITLAGGSPVTPAQVQIDVASHGSIFTYHLFDSGSYPTNSTTSFTTGSTTGSCSGVTFVGATFLQTLVSTSAPNVQPQGGSPLLNAGNTNYCPSQNFFGSTRSCPPNIGAY